MTMAATHQWAPVISYFRPPHRQLSRMTGSYPPLLLDIRHHGSQWRGRRRFLLTEQVAIFVSLFFAVFPMNYQRARPRVPQKFWIRDRSGEQKTAKRPAVRSLFFAVFVKKNSEDHDLPLAKFISPEGFRAGRPLFEWQRPLAGSTSRHNMG